MHNYINSQMYQCSYMTLFLKMELEWDSKFAKNIHCVLWYCTSRHENDKMQKHDLDDHVFPILIRFYF
jgi:hypothetical protein